MDSKKRRSDRCMRPRLRPPGRPPVATRREEQLFWSLIATGISSKAAAIKGCPSAASATVLTMPSPRRLAACKSRGLPVARAAAQLRNRRICRARMSRLIQSSRAVRTHRGHPAWRSQISLLSYPRSDRSGSANHIQRPRANPVGSIPLFCNRCWTRLQRAGIEHAAAWPHGKRPYFIFGKT